MNENADIEFWDILDSHGRKTGRQVKRGDPMNQTEYHLVVHVWIMDLSGQYLISKRTPNKTYPNLWETTGGSALQGETSLNAALREVKEEIGIRLDPQNGKLLFRTKRQHCDFPDFLDVWMFIQNSDLKDIVCQADEVCDAKWASKETIFKMLDDNCFVDTLRYFQEFHQP